MLLLAITQPEPQEEEASLLSHDVAASSAGKDKDLDEYIYNVRIQPLFFSTIFMRNTDEE